MRELVLNRPVHIAGRDASYEQAVKLLQGDLMNYDVPDRLEKCRAITSLLNLANEHGNFAMRGTDPCREEKLFVKFTALLLDSAHSLQVMTKHELLLMSDRELLREFLGQNGEPIDRSAAEHRQLALNLLKETLQLIQMAADAFHKLKTQNLAVLDKDDAHARYLRAYESFQRQHH